MAPTTVRRGHDKLSTKVSGRHKQRDRESQQHYHRPEKSGSDTIKGEGDTALEAKAQLYSDNSIDLKIMQVKECKAIRPAK